LPIAIWESDWPKEKLEEDEFLKPLVITGSCTVKLVELASFANTKGAKTKLKTAIKIIIFILKKPIY
jgi:hypothetical protein